MWISNIELQPKHIKVEPDVELLLDSQNYIEQKHNQPE
jgi:hypothetical protein